MPGLVACEAQASKGILISLIMANHSFEDFSSTGMIGCCAAQAAAEWPQVQEAVAKLCLAWWQAEAPGRAALVPQTLPYLLVRALTGAPRRSRALEGFQGFSQSLFKQAPRLTAWADACLLQL